MLLINVFSRHAKKNAMVVLFHGGLLLRQVEFCGCFSFEFLEFHPLRVSKSCTLLKLHYVCVCSSMCSCVGLYSNVYIILRVALSVQPAQFRSVRLSTSLAQSALHDFRGLHDSWTRVSRLEWRLAVSSPLTRRFPAVVGIVISKIARHFFRCLVESVGTRCRW